MGDLADYYDDLADERRTFPHGVDPIGDTYATWLESLPEAHGADAGVTDDDLAVVVPPVVDPWTLSAAEFRAAAEQYGDVL